MVLDEVRGGARWRSLSLPIDDLPVDLMYYQDDVFVIETLPDRLSERIKLIQEGLRGAGLELAMEKTTVVAAADYNGVMFLELEGRKITFVREEGIKVLGLTFRFQGSLSDQAQELLDRARVALAEHSRLLQARGSWKRKLFLIHALISSTWRWCAGAVHWSQECLSKANTLQLHVMRVAFKLHRAKDEDWVSWNSRTLRYLRAYLVKENEERWSACALRLQFSLHGHWARRIEDLGSGIGDLHPCLPMQVAAITETNDESSQT
eukprot:s3585_g4.t1